MTSGRIRNLFFALFALLFFGYLFGPLILMSLTAFNSSAFPRVSPWECFSGEWFVKLSQDAKLMGGLKNSLLIGFGVILIAVPIGLAASIVLTQVWKPIRPIFYTIVISPILVPGVVLGISTLIFWDRLGTMLDANYNSFFYDGIFLTIIGQATFISAYCMLVFLARLQRFDPALEEAALDLGATNVQAFRKVLLPFLKPAIGSAAVLAFLASFENYNTTVFTIISESTLTTVLASKVRYGIDPSISALAVIIVALTLIGAVAHEIYKRREERIAREMKLEAAGLAPTRASRAAWIANPTMILMILITLAGIGTIWMASTYSVQECKGRILEEKRLRQQQFVPVTPQTQTPEATTPGTTTPGTPAPESGDAPAKQYQGIFDPNALKGEQSDEESNAPSKQYQGIFDPKNLQNDDSEEQAPAEPDKQYQGIFDPKNLQNNGSD